MTQANSIAGAALSSFHIAPLAVGILLVVFSGMVILGGIKRIAAVTEKFVPFMALFYITGGAILIFLNRDGLGAAFSAIFSGAFSPKAAAGGVGGYALAMRFGVARGIFSNEAGLGSSVIVNSASNVKEPVQQGMWGIFEVFADTIVVCTITALCILTTGALDTGLDGAALSIAAFSHGFGAFAGAFVTIAICCFAFSTILGWSYYGERALEYLSGTKLLLPYRLLFVAMTAVGACANLQTVWKISDTFNGLMALPNLLAILLLSREVFRITQDYPTPGTHNVKKEGTSNAL